MIEKYIKHFLCVIHRYVPFPSFKTNLAPFFGCFCVLLGSLDRLLCLGELFLHCTHRHVKFLSIFETLPS